MPDQRKGKRWSRTVGTPPHTVRVYERGVGGVLYAATWDPEARNGRGGERRVSLGHRDRERALEWAKAQAEELREGTDDLRGDRPTVRRLIALYRRHRSPDKSEAVQQEDERMAEMWRRVLGDDFDLRKLSRREWDRFIRQRRAGAVGPRGKAVPEEAPCPACDGDPACGRCDGSGEVDPRSPVSDRTVERDLRFLRAVCRWAMDFRTEDGRLLLREDPTRGREIPTEKNPSRPVATHDRVDAIREVYRDVTMRVERQGERQEVESYLPEIFEIVVGTGRRISAVCGLRMEDLELEATPRTPHGAICWPADTDKVGKRWRCPISKPVRDALEAARWKRRRQGIVGPGPLFPAPGTADKPVRYQEAGAWLRRAETLADLEPHDGSLWHAYRRLWASARKDLPDVDVAQAGGWSSLEALKLAYQQPDDETMLRVVEHDAELREVR